MTGQASTNIVPLLGGTMRTFLYSTVSQASMCVGMRGPTTGPLLLLLPDGLQTHWDAPAFHWIRTGTLNEDQCCPRPASPQQLGFRKGVRHLVRILWTNPLRRHLPSLLRGEEAGKEPLGELQQHCWEDRPNLVPTILQGVEGQILQSMLL